MNQSTGIHCKVICEDQMRRFQFSGTEFASLQHQVNQLLGLNREFVLKYKDNEGDMITISSTEELSCAVEISQKENGGLFRLSVFLTEPTTVTGPIHPEHGRAFCHRGYGGKWGHHGRGFGCREDGTKFPHQFERPGFEFGGPASSDPQPWKGKRCHGSELPCKNRFEKRGKKLMFKRDMLKAYLSSLEQMKELSPEDERRKQMFQAKVQHIDSILSQFAPQTDQVVCPTEKPEVCSVGGAPESEFCPKYKKCHRKFEKKAKKFEKEHKEEKKKEEKINLSEEAKTEINTLKNQIKELKPALWAIKVQLKTKKAEARKSFESGQNPRWSPTFRSDIIKLKQEKKAIKEKIAPLRERMHLLKAGGK